MTNLRIKQFNSEDFNYYEQTLNKFLPLFSACAQIMSDNKCGHNLTIQDLQMPLPHKNAKNYAEQTIIHYINEHISDNAKAFVLYNQNNQPLSVALFSNIDNSPNYVLEVVQTLKGHEGKGYATYLLNNCFEQLKEQALSVTSIVKEDNYSSIALNDKLNSYKKKDFAITNGVKQIHYTHVINERMINLIKAKEQQLEQEKE